MLRRLNFHRALDNGRFRLPKVRHANQETYESLYKVLDELEIMLKAWKKRTEHVFTAHIQKGDDGERGGGRAQDGDDAAAASGDDSSMRFGVDYSDSDIAHESDDDDGGGGGEEFHGGGGIGVWMADGDEDNKGGGEAEGANANGAAKGNGAAAAAAPKASNESLTKKKYCQSTRLFYSVFDGAAPEKKFEALSSLVRR